MKKIIAILLLLVSINANCQDSSRINDFNNTLKTIVKKDSITFNDLNNLLSFEDAIKYIYATKYLSIDDKIIYKRVNNLINKKSIDDKLEFDRFIDSLDSKRIYVYTLFIKLGRDISQNVLSITDDVKQLFLHYNAGFGVGYLFDKRLNQYFSSTMLNFDVGVDYYNNSLINSDKTYLTGSFIGGSIIANQNTLSRLFGIELGLGSEKQNLNGYEISFEYLYNINANDTSSKNLLGLTYSLRSNSPFSFCANFFTQPKDFFSFNPNKTIVLFSVKYNLFSFFGKREY